MARGRSAAHGHTIAAMSGVDPGAEERELRRAERARRRAQPPPRRRSRSHGPARLLAALALVAVGAAAAFALTRTGGGDPSPDARAQRAGSTSATHVALRPLGPTVTGAAARRAIVPILMYHVIAAPPPGTPYPQLWVTPEAFAAQMHALATAGYHGITLAEAFAAWEHGARIPEHPVVVSFDDGYRSHSTAAAPVLKTLGWPGVLNLEIDNAGAGGITLSRLKRLVRDGWEIDSHTVTHPDLTTLGPDALRAELARSRAWIERELGVPADFFCYPAGKYDPTVVTAVRAAGYRGATSELPGAATARSDPYLLPRVRVSGTDSATSVLAALTPA